MLHEPKRHGDGTVTDTCFREKQKKITGRVGGACSDV
jgi:hypothetical protein